MYMYHEVRKNLVWGSSPYLNEISCMWHIEFQWGKVYTTKTLFRSRAIGGLEFSQLCGIYKPAHVHTNRGVRPVAHKHASKCVEVCIVAHCTQMEERAVKTSNKVVPETCH